MRRHHEQHGLERDAALGYVEAHFQQRPGEAGDGFSQPGVVGQDQPIMEGGAGVVLALESFEPEWGFNRHNQVQGIGTRWLQ